MAGTVVADTLQADSTSTLVLKNGVANTPPTVQDSAGTQIGTFCRAWVNFNGTTNVGGFCTIRASFNVSSVADNGTGDYTINFTTAMPDANYGVSSTISGFFGTGFFLISAVKVKTDNTGPDLQSTTQVKLVSGTGGGTSTDVPVFNVAIFR